MKTIFTTRKRSLGQGNIFTSACHPVHRRGCACHTCPPAMHPPATHAPLPHMPPCHACPPATHHPLPHMLPCHICPPLPCTLYHPCNLPCMPPCHAFPPSVMHAPHILPAMHNNMRSMSGWYTSYWNTFLFLSNSTFKLCCITCDIIVFLSLFFFKFGISILFVDLY